jgi:hypothetical protein
MNEEVMMPGAYHEYSRQQSADRVRDAWASRRAKLTRRAQIGATRRAFIATGAVLAGMIRLFGGGGGV